MDTNRDSQRLLKIKRHADFFNVNFEFDKVVLLDPMDKDKSTRQVHRDANAVMESAPSHSSLLKAAEKDLRAQGLLDFAHVLSELTKSPVALAKKLRAFIDHDMDKPPPKPVSSEDALRLVFTVPLSVEGYRVITNAFFLLSYLQESIGFGIDNQIHDNSSVTVRTRNWST